MIRPLRITVQAILDHSTSFEWSVQGFGMLRLYIRKIGRLHIWDSALRYPNVTMIHNHSWDLVSTVVCGRLVNTRYRISEKNEEGVSFNQQQLITGYQTRMTTPVQTVPLSVRAEEVYTSGQVYSQYANEIHRTDAINGTVTLMERIDDEEGRAEVYWPSNTEWGTAKPRLASLEEVKTTVAKAQIEFDQVCL